VLVDDGIRLCRILVGCGQGHSTLQATANTF
jgi:hypothetical protein